MSRRLGLSGSCLLLAAPLLAPSAARSAPPDLLFQAEGQTLSGTCTGQAVRIEGNRNTLTLSGPCQSLLLKGVDNTVRLALVPAAPVRVEGSGNHVRYAVTGTGPAIVILGPDNDVSGGDISPAPAPVATAAPPAALPHANPSPKPPAALAPIQPGPAGTAITLAGNDQERLGNCAGRNVVVTGMRSAYVLRGGCRSLTVRGDLLTVQAELEPGAKITIHGQGSIVSWIVPPKSRSPASIVRGAGSRAQRVEAIGGDPEP
jgi:hypothetical protein